MSLGYGILGSVFFKAPEDYQWVLALMSPLYQMFIFKVVLAVAYKSAGKDLYGNSSIKFLALHFVAAKHAVFLAITVGGIATPETTYTIMAVDFAERMIETLKIIRKQQSGNLSKGNQIE